MLPMPRLVKSVNKQQKTHPDQIVALLLGPPTSNGSGVKTSRKRQSGAVPRGGD